jgi:hypothetical protein
MGLLTPTECVAGWGQRGCCGPTQVGAHTRTTAPLLGTLTAAMHQTSEAKTAAYATADERTPQA